MSFTRSLGRIDKILPVRLNLGRLRADFLRDWLDFVEFDPYGLVG